MIVNAVIEIHYGTPYKYEIDKSDGSLVLDRVLDISLPTNYGFIPGTLCDDKDALDIFVISGHPIAPLAKVKVNILGMFRCLDGGIKDDKLVGILGGYSLEEREITMNIDQIQYYLDTYKKDFVVQSFHGIPEAIQTYQLSRIWPNPAS